MTIFSNSPDNSKPTVLVIEDDESIRALLNDVLELEGLQVISASDGLEGELLYQKHQEAVALIILDLRLPGQDGPITFTHLRQINPDVKVIIASGYTQEKARDLLDTDLEVAFARKPFDFNTLLKTVWELIR